ncbi:MAG: selenide, water dikinase SelD, partial [Deltaproteobacteria bacterium]|nr:selenide, water dikinase SelD [Deltaproteobacteria bacterium]
GAADVSPILSDILYDPQTSGGLLISIPSAKAEDLVAALKKEGLVYSSIVGEVVKDHPGKIQLI